MTEQSGDGDSSQTPWEKQRDRLPVVLLAIGMVISGVLLLNLTSNLTFIGDDWNLLLLRQGWGTTQILAPFGGHPMMTPVSIYKSFQDIFGMESATPQHCAAIAFFLLMNALLFCYLRRRVGSWGALIGTTLILFLGGAFEDLLYSFQMVYTGALAAGIAALLALDRDDHRGDVAAAILLVVSLTFSGVGLTFVAAAIAEWALNPRDRKRRLFVPLAPILFFVLWWLGWGHATDVNSLQPSYHLSVVPKIPKYIFNAFAAGLTAIAGLATGDGSEPSQPNLIWGQLGALVLIGLAIWRIRSLGRAPRAFLMTVAAALCFYLLLAVAQDAYLTYGPAEIRYPTASRYQLPSAVFIILMASNLLKGLRIPPWGMGLAGVLSLFAIAGGIQLMTNKADERWEPAASYTKATLAGIEAAAPDTKPGFTFRLATSFEIPVDDYMRAIKAHGSPAYSPAELSDTDVPFRSAADSALVAALGLELTGAPPAFAKPDCKEPSMAQPLVLKPGSYSVTNSGNSDLSLGLSRFGDPPGLSIGAVLPNSTAGLELPAGSVNAPWVLSFGGTGPVRVCSGKNPGV